ncbi:MAG: creatininase family protein [Rhizobiales bacterium]|nr:creatininase family protein [Hyphomicrobiales bacterium]OJU33909.1 MAG: hypothetical protein BGN94_13575 [Rhizobiales bacterium 68-8]
MFLASMSSREIADRVAAGATTAVLVAGSIEQHGPHLPCDADATYGAEMGRRLAEALGSALVAPVVTPGCSDHHVGFAGTFTITPELLVALVEARLRDLSRMGFREVVLTSSHGGNFRPLQAALPQLSALADGLRLRLTPVLVLEDFIAALVRAPRARGLDQKLPAVQADLVETSIMLRLRPDQVRMDLAEPGGLTDFTLDELLERGLAAVTHNGVVGDPRAATAELGEAILNDLRDYLVSGVNQWRQSA